MQTVLLLFGGESTEHEVSIVSATNISRTIDTNKYNIMYVFIDRAGKWWQVPGIVKSVPDGSAQLLPRMGEASFQIAGSDEVVSPDVIFPVLHGRNGEDGSVQALAQLLHIPVVGCDMTSSAAAMNKYLTKQVAIANDLQVVPFGIHHIGDPVPVFEKVSEVLGTTLFIKPANAGSSVGVHKVQNQDELTAALEDAHRYDDIVLMEKSINARELEVAVLGNYPDIQASVVGEITPEGDFYSYESKYDSSSTSAATIPAEISPE
ncbi:D-alanine--D-alanine ligase A, partial [Candidatus Saccharibacteria bacterium]|nr:D-alanine--D-alanine ligase A [Candidatus Saccharibacteria bacterium]